MSVLVETAAPSVEIAPDALRMIVDALIGLADDAAMTITRDGIDIRRFDPAHVAQIHIHLSAPHVTILPGKPEGVIPLPAERLHHALKHLRPPRAGAPFGLTWTRDTSTLTLSTLTHLITLTQEEEITPAKLSTFSAGLFTARALITPNALDEAIALAEAISTFRLTLRAEHGVLTASAEGNTISARTEIGHIEGDAVSTYSIDYLKQCVKAAGRLGTLIEVQFGTDTPITFTAGDGDNSITTALAPIPGASA